MWHAILDAETKRRCWTVIGEIERCLIERAPSDTESRGARSPELANGTAGEALFFAYLDAARPDDETASRALALLDRSISALAEGELLPSLFSGYSGIGWVVEHLTRELFEGDETLCCEIDEAILGILTRPDVPLPFEVIGGLAGFGTYLVERLPHPDAENRLALVIAALAASVEKSRQGCTWRTLPDWLASAKRERYPLGAYDLGIAHGVPGVIGFLAAARREGMRDPRLDELAEAGVRWLLAQRRPRDRFSHFPSLVESAQDADPTRTAWCYGDLGVACILLSAARSFGRKDWEQEAMSVALGAAERAAPDTLAAEPGLCHGWAGLAHLFNRLFQATHEIAFQRAARTWLDHTLSQWSPDGEDNLRQRWKGIPPVTYNAGKDYGFLSGLAGVGLALIAAASEVEPAWDRVLLVSVPPL